MAARKEGYWESTNATAWSLMALAAYMRASGEMRGDYSYSIYLNGELLGGGRVTKENVDENATVRVGPTSMIGLKQLNSSQRAQTSCSMSCWL